MPATKKTTAKKVTSKQKTSSPKTTTTVQTEKSGLSNTAMMGVLHLIGGVLGTWGWLAVIIYYIIKKSTFSDQDMEVFYNIINFNLSFLLYAVLSGFLVVILIGIPMLIVVSVAYIVLLVISSLHYITDKNYSIPFSIHILK